MVTEIDFVYVHHILMLQWLIRIDLTNNKLQLKTANIDQSFYENNFW